MKIVNISEFQTRTKKKKENQEIPREYYENHENIKIPIENKQKSIQF